MFCSLIIIFRLKKALEKGESDDMWQAVGGQTYRLLLEEFNPGYCKTVVVIAQLQTHELATNIQLNHKLTIQKQTHKSCKLPTHNSTTNSQVSYQPTTQPQTHNSTTNSEVSCKPTRQQHSNNSDTNSQISRTFIINNQLKTHNLTKSQISATN